MIDFTECKRVFGKAYNGANGKKIAVEYDGNQYMLKFPPSVKERPTELSYTSSCISEHIASSIFNMLGIAAQQTLLGTFVVNGKEKVVCACKDFTMAGKILYDFCSIKNTVIDSEHNGSGTELADEKIMKNVLENENELNARIYQFPKSAIKLNGKKINYYDFLMSAEYKKCNEALSRIVPKINIKKIRNFIDEVSYISELQKEFYKTYISARYEKIILPSYEQVFKLLSQEENNSLMMQLM